MKRPPTLFFVLVFGWTWSFWLATAALGAGAHTPAGDTLLSLGLVGPLLGGVGFACFAHGAGYRRDYWRRLVEIGRIPPRWGLFVVLFAPLLMVAAVLLDVAAGQGEAPPLIAERASSLLSTPAVVPSFLLTVLLNGPLPEELGWRGYALDRLGPRRHPLAASLTLGAVWAVWHLPLFFMPGMLHARHGAASAWFWLFMTEVVAASILYTWIFNNTRRSTLAAIIFHFSSNLAYSLGNVTERTNLFATLLLVAAAVVVAASGAGKTRPFRSRGLLHGRSCATLVSYGAGHRRRAGHRLKIGFEPIRKRGDRRAR
jgi:membrane protease YdiL (CAAX protease family)